MPQLLSPEMALRSSPSGTRRIPSWGQLVGGALAGGLGAVWAWRGGLCPGVLAAHASLHLVVCTHVDTSRPQEGAGGRAHLGFGLRAREGSCLQGHGSPACLVSAISSLGSLKRTRLLCRPHVQPETSAGGLSVRGV